MRINKYISACGICSRREADRLVAAGEVRINGMPAEMGSSVEEGDQVTLRGELIRPRQEHIYLKFYKPKGIVCTSERREKNNLIDYLQMPDRVTYAGRLDKNSEGLLLLTDDGDLIDALMRGAHHHEKEYLVRVDRPLTEDFLNKMRQGIYLPELEQTTRSCQVEQIDERFFKIILTQGLNRQIRRMCEACGYRVQHLKRVRIANLLLGDMQRGEKRALTARELEQLKKSVKK